MYLIGNGGSHATAAHMANDLIKMGKVKAVCIGDMTAVMTAFGNDNGWKNMFVDPLKEMLVKGKDAVFALTCSGNSENVVNALDWATGEGVLTVCLTGPAMNNRVSDLGVNALVRAVAADIRVQEDVHAMVCHAIVREMQGLA